MAKKYRMNTDTRKNIFCILFSAEVYYNCNIVIFNCLNSENTTYSNL